MAVVRHLVGQGAVLDTVDIDGTTPLKVALCSGHALVAASLCTAGAR